MKSLKTFAPYNGADIPIPANFVVYLAALLILNGNGTFPMTSPALLKTLFIILAVGLSAAPALPPVTAILPKPVIRSVAAPVAPLSNTSSG